MKCPEASRSGRSRSTGLGSPRPTDEKLSYHGQRDALRYRMGNLAEGADGSPPGSVWTSCPRVRSPVAGRCLFCLLRTPILRSCAHSQLGHFWQKSGQVRHGSKLAREGDPERSRVCVTQRNAIHQREERGGGLLFIECFDRPATRAVLPLALP